jgi:2-furoyl-CoA dehydrogenase FAD binding subunit
LAAAGAGFAFDEVARRHGDFAIVSLAAMAHGDVLRLGVGGVADRPTVREWRGLADSDWPDALNDFAWTLGGRDDLHASAAYRRDLVRRLGARLLREARSCAA